MTNKKQYYYNIIGVPYQNYNMKYKPKSWNPIASSLNLLEVCTTAGS